MARSRQEIDAARHLLSGGFVSQAMSRAYYATFYAAQAALASVGQTRSKHSGVITAFGQYVVQTGGVERETGRGLRVLFDQRTRADYGDEEPTHDDVERAIADAVRFVDAIAGWLARREPPA